MPPPVSIIIPACNEAADIRETLDSLAALDWIESAANLRGLLAGAMELKRAGAT